MIIQRNIFNKTILYFGIISMLLGQCIGNDWQYFAGVYIFASCTLHYLSVKLEGIESQIMQFFCGAAIYNIFKPLLEDVSKDSIYEYFGFCAGLLFVLGRYVFRLHSRQ